MNKKIKVLQLGILISILTPVVFSCKPTAQSIVDDAIEACGGNEYQNLDVGFDFRKATYKINTVNGIYTYTRIQTDSSGNIIKDMMTDNSFERKINDSVVTLPDSMVNKYRNSINSVAYFFLLPKPLNDPSVNKELLDEVKIKDKEYYKIKVTFDQEGGGKDFQDVYVYWFEKNSLSMDYFAYSYETNGGGVRFREAFDCNKSKIKYCNYRNYGFEDLQHKTEDLDLLFEKGDLPLKSEIINENVVIK